MLLFFQDQYNKIEVSTQLDRKILKRQSIHSISRSSYDTKGKHVTLQGIQFHPMYLGQMTHMKILDEDLNR